MSKLKTVIQLHSIRVTSLTSPHDDLPGDMKMFAQLIVEDHIFLQTLPVASEDNQMSWKLGFGCKIPPHAPTFSVTVLRQSETEGTRVLGYVEIGRGEVLESVESKKSFQFKCHKVNPDGPSLNFNAGFSVSELPYHEVSGLELSGMPEHTSEIHYTLSDYSRYPSRSMVASRYYAAADRVIQWRFFCPSSFEHPFVKFPQFPGDEQKAPINNLDTAPYVFPGSRSISPSSTTPSSSSASLTSPFQFAFSENTECAEYDCRRNSNPRSDVGIHGANSEISLTAGPGSDAVRYRLGTRRADSSADRPILPILPPLSVSENGSQHDRVSSDGDSNSYAYPRLRPRRDSLISPPSRSSSPTVPPQLSGTLAVIKARAFGALRRTRARAKKTSDGAAKTALDVLEARGIEMGVSSGSRRQRTDDSDDGEIQT
ncbi:hypothetical protein C8J57DRAFT_1562049, partial [Mycena rebaudengoi]